MSLRRVLMFCALLVGSCGSLFAQDANSKPASTTWMMLFLGPRQAVPLEIRVYADDGPAARRKKLAELLLTRFDLDHDGVLSGEEAAKVPRGAKASGPGMGEDWKSLDRQPADQTLNLDEVLSFVDRELGPAFQISTRPPRLAQSVQLVERVDQDHDSAVSADELEDSLASLRSSDLDDDEAVSVGELQPFPRRGIVRQPAQQPLESPLISIETAAEIDSAVERLIKTYGVGDSSVTRQIAVEEADADGNGTLTAGELKMWLEARRSQWIITARLNQKRASTVEVQKAESSTPGERPAPPASRVSLSLGGAEVEVSALNNKFEQADAGKMYGVRFLQSDRDKNGYLSDMEFAGLQLNVPFQDVDANGDGMLFRDELNTFVSFDAISVQARMELMVTDEGKTLFELLDANVDRRLTPRELREGFTRLKSVDRDQDQRVAQSELESRFRLTFSFGRNQIFTPPTPGMNAPVTARLRNLNEGPVWFRRMDRNQDGDITWREFLGTREQFQQLDVDGDDLVNWKEADAPAEPPATSQEKADAR